MTASELLELMRRRQSSRVSFDPYRPIGPNDLARLIEAARWAPTAHNMQNFELMVIDDRPLLEALSDLETGGVDETFVRENYAQLSFSEDELKRKKVGILAANFPPSWLKPDFKADPKEVRAHSFLGDPVRMSGALLLVLYDPKRRAPASEGDFLGIISLGCVMENLWLMASSLGIACQIQSALAAAPVEAGLKRVLGVPEHLRIAYAVRLGYPLEPADPLRVRRDPKDFVHHNRFGHRFAR